METELASKVLHFKKINTMDEVPIKKNVSISFSCAVLSCLHMTIWQCKY